MPNLGYLALWCMIAHHWLSDSKRVRAEWGPRLLGSPRLKEEARHLSSWILEPDASFYVPTHGNIECALGTREQNSFSLIWRSNGTCLYTMCNLMLTVRI